MKNLPDRIKFWKHTFKCQGGSTEFLNENLDLFVGKNVLEIGPGEGRQTLIVLNGAASCSIADICQDVLDLHVYDNIKIKNKFLITSYSNNFNLKFDIVHFWYVLHHVLPDELESFFSFVDRHCKNRGVIIFNFQDIKKYQDISLSDDGLKTSKLDKDKVINVVEKFFTITKQVQYETQDEHQYINILAHKR